MKQLGERQNGPAGYSRDVLGSRSKQLGRADKTRVHRAVDHCLEGVGDGLCGRSLRARQASVYPYLHCW